MNRQAQIAAIKRIEHNAGLLKQVALQITEEATRLEDQAKAAQEALGSAPVRARKGKHQLSPEIALQIKGNMTRKANRNKV